MKRYRLKKRIETPWDIWEPQEVGSVSLAGGEIRSASGIKAHVLPHELENLEWFEEIKEPKYTIDAGFKGDVVQHNSFDGETVVAYVSGLVLNEDFRYAIITKQ